MIHKPKGLKDLGPKSPIQWICREWVRKLSSNELNNNYSGPRWQESQDKVVLSKENRSRHNLRRSVIVYISFEFDYKSSSCGYSVFPLISQYLLLKVFFLFYTVFLLSSPPSTCRPRFLCRSMSYQHLPYVFESSCKAENYCLSITSTLMRPES